MVRLLVRRKCGERGVADQKHIEVLRQILETGRRPAKTHVCGITCQQHMPHSLRLQEVSQDGIALSVVDDNVVRMDFQITGHRNRQIPESRIVEFWTGVQSRKLLEVVDHWLAGRERQLLRNRLAFVLKCIQHIMQLAPSGFGLIFRRASAHGAIQFLPDRVLLSRQAVHDAVHVAAQLVEEWSDHFPCVPASQMILRRCAEVRATSWFGSSPSLSVVDSPGMHHNDGRRFNVEAIRHLNDPTGIV